MKQVFGLLLAVFYLLSSPLVAASKDVKPNYVYFSLDPDIITNYVSSTNEIGFINVSVELMLVSEDNLAIIEQYEPLIRDKIISLLGQQSPQELRSMTGREAVRKRIQNEVNSLLKQESGVAAIANLLFTKYLLL